MSTLQDALTFARAQALTDSNGLTDTIGIVFANEALFDFRRQLTTHGIDASSLQEAYRDASVPASGNGSTFLYPIDLSFLKAIEVNYQDSSAQNYITAEQIDHSNIPGQQSFSWLRLNASVQAPKFADNGDWFEIFPAFISGNNLTGAIRIIYFQKPSEYTATSDTISYPESLDYRILGLKIAADFCQSIQSFDLATVCEARYQKRVDQYVSTLGRGAQQPLQATVIPLTGWEF